MCVKTSSYHDFDDAIARTSVYQPKLGNVSNDPALIRIHSYFVNMDFDRQVNIYK